MRTDPLCEMYMIWRSPECAVDCDSKLKGKLGQNPNLQYVKESPNVKSSNDVLTATYSVTTCNRTSTLKLTCFGG